MEVSASVQVPASAHAVWRTVGDFAGLAVWHPVIAATQTENGGQQRRVTLVDGSELAEELVAHDDAGTRYSYRIVEAGPLPVRDYEASIAVRDTGDGGCEVRWDARFEPVGNATLAEQTIQRVYQTGLDNLRTLFGGT
jgi:carbon monoxide dehydrogenase subunit G